jgi:hypothetical protein
MTSARSPTTSSSPCRSTWAPTSSRRSGLGDELNYVPVDKHTMPLHGIRDIWALGDASNIPTSKAGSVAHFSVEVFVENFQELVAGRPLTHSFDGHANCFIESGGGKALLLDFNYDTEPLGGTFPLPKVGPMSLLKESPRQPPRQARLPAHLLERPAARPAPRACRRHAMAGKNPNLTTPTEKRPTPTPHQGAHTMTTTTIAGHEVDVNEEGFLTKPEQWRRGTGPRACRQSSASTSPTSTGCSSASCAPTTPPWGDRDAAPGLDPDRHTGQGALRPLPRQAGQEDGLRLRAAQAQGLRLTSPCATRATPPRRDPPATRPSHTA